MNDNNFVETDNNKVTKKDGLTANKIIYYILGILEVLFAFRLVFKVLGANAESGFVSIIYSITGLFLTPFTAIFRSATTQGIETKAVLEPSTIIAMIVYALIAWGLAKLISIIKGRNQDNGTV
ncbi:MAG: hypothetical protein WBI07_10755 [Mobilitalea sp.]